MKRLRVATAFTGGGVCLNRLDQARYEIAWGIEYDAKKAAVYSQNYPGSTMYISRIQDIDWHSLPPVDLFQVSPECKEFSSANVNGEEGPEQLSQAEAICQGLRILQPKYYVLENVRGYLHSQSLDMIRKTLAELGYWYDCQVLNSANFGVAQTRERLILRAVKDQLVPILPPPTRWIGWYEAIEDLIPTLPGTHFADWQLARLPNDVPKAFVIAGDNINNENYWRQENEPMHTVRATSSKAPTKAWLSQGRVVKMTPCALARFMSMLDSYRLPDNNRLACEIIGNGFPSEMARILIDGLTAAWFARQEQAA